MIREPARAVAPWMVASIVCGTAVAGFLRVAAEDVHPLAMPFFRAAFALPLVLPWFVHRLRVAPTEALAPRAPWRLHIARAVAMVAVVAFFVLAIERMSIADATALALVGPVLAAAFGAMLLGERAGAWGWAAIALGLGGALIVVGPSGEATAPGTAFGLLTAAAAAVDWLLLKRISRHDGMGRATALLTVLMVPFALPLALLVWTWPGASALLALVGVALASTAAQVLAVRAFALGKLWHLGALGYLSIPLAAVMGWLFFAESVEPWTLVGGGVIVAASVALAQFQAARE